MATFLIHSKIDCCNSLLLNIPATQTNRLQLVLNSAARAVTRTPKFYHIISILKSLHWLKINEIIKHEVVSHIHLSKLVNLLTSPLFFHSLHIVLLGLLLLITLTDVHLSPLVLKLLTDLLIFLLLFFGTVSHLIYVTLFFTSLLHLY